MKATQRKVSATKAARLSDVLREIDERMNAAWAACAEPWQERLCNEISMAVVDAILVVREREAGQARGVRRAS